MGKICEGGRGVEIRGVRDVKRRVQEKGKRGRKERGGDRKIMEREGDTGRKKWKGEKIWGVGESREKGTG